MESSGEVKTPGSNQPLLTLIQAIVVLSIHALLFTLWQHPLRPTVSRLHERLVSSPKHGILLRKNESQPSNCMQTLNSSRNVRIFSRKIYISHSSFSSGNVSKDASGFTTGIPGANSTYLSASSPTAAPVYQTGQDPASLLMNLNTQTLDDFDPSTFDFDSAFPDSSDAAFGDLDGVGIPAQGMSAI
jgi:hypothetical protein